MITIIDARLFKFAVVGLTGMAIDFSITWFCKEKLLLNKYIANSLGFCCAVTNNFLLNRYWTFTSNGYSFGEQFAKFAMVSLAGLLINNVLLYFLSKYIKTNFYLIKLTVTGLVFFWNYFINFLFTFK
jgi:putative flippase GtrA